MTGTGGGRLRLWVGVLAAAIAVALAPVSTAEAGKFLKPKTERCAHGERLVRAVFTENPLKRHHVEICEKTRGYRGKRPSYCQRKGLITYGFWKQKDRGCKGAPPPKKNPWQAVKGAWDKGVNEAKKKIDGLKTKLGMDDRVQRRAEEEMRRNAELILAVLKLAGEITGAQTRALLEQKKLDDLERVVTRSPSFGVVRDLSRHAKFETFTVGLSGGVDVVAIGADGEHGVGIDFGNDRKAKWYAQTSVGLGFAAGAGLGITLGLARSRNNALSGHSVGAAFDPIGFAAVLKDGAKLKELAKFKAKLGAGFAISVWFEAEDDRLKLSAINVTPGIGAGFDTGSVMSAWTVQAP